MHYKNAAIIVAGLAAQRVVATSGWTDASSYSCPGNTDNSCSDSQQGGYDWSGLDEGDFRQYGSNDFSGFKCSNSYGKRDLLTKRTFQSKCITGGLDDQPSMSCGSDDSMSIDEMEVSSDQDADVECEYGMPDGSTCKEYHSCSAGGSVFKNTQCGGAKSVTFKPGKNAPAGCSIGVHSVGFHCGSASSSVPAYSSTPVSSYPASTAPASSSAYPSSSYGCHGSDCSSSVVASSYGCYGPECSTAAPSSSGYVASSYGCHGPECSSAAPSSSKYVASSYGCQGEDCYGSSSSFSPVSSIPAYSTPVASYPVPSSYACHGEDCYGSSSSFSPVSSIPAYSTPVASYPVPSSYACHGEDCSSSHGYPGNYGSSSSFAPVSSSVVASSYGCHGPDCGPGGYGSSSSFAPVSSSVVASSYGCYGPDCGPGGYGSSSSFAPVSTSVPASSYGCHGEDCYGSSTFAPVSSSSSAPHNYPTPNCPDLLPRCLNTWMYTSGCKDNSDSDCFCKNVEFINNVMGCISAWSESEEDTQAAASYLMGICAPHVPSNPAIITACPSTVTPGPSPSGYTPAASSPPVSAVPVPSSSAAPTSYSHGPASPEQTAPCTTITYSSSAVVPATYSTGPSAGYTYPGSSYTTEIVTTVTVPQVQFTTATVTSAGTTTKSVGLGAGQPSSVAAYTTPAASAPGAYGSSAGAVGTSFGTSWAPSASGSYSPIAATGEGAKVGSGLAGLALGAIAALAAL